jgi:hypothetical protein
VINLDYEVHKYPVPDLYIDLTPLDVLERLLDDRLLGVETGKGFESIERLNVVKSGERTASWVLRFI